LDVEFGGGGEDEPYYIASIREVVADDSYKFSVFLLPLPNTSYGSSPEFLDAPIDEIPLQNRRTYWIEFLPV